MKAIYFSENNESDGIKKLTRFATKKFTQISPKVSAQLAMHLLCNPYSRRDYTLNTMTSMETHDLETPLGSLRLYELPGGPRHIIMSHGWGDTTARFRHMMNHFHEQGFSVWSFDHIGHGHSAGKVSHLFAYLMGWRHAIKHIEQQGQKLEAAIAHSMGAFSLLNLEPRYLPEKKVLLSIPPEFFNSMFHRISQAGISKTTVANLLNHLSSQHSLNWKDFNLVNHRDKIDLNTLFVHDKEDRIADYKKIEPFIINQSQSYLTEGLGHVRILKNKNVFDRIGSFLDEKK